ncbi:unnamed protein product, partial [Brassica oleracea var. botrytis]
WRRRLYAQLFPEQQSPQLRGHPLLQRRRFSSSSGLDDAYESGKWESIAYLGIFSCTLIAAYVLSEGHQHGEDPPAYPYMHIRNKEFPWGPDGLFEVKHNEGH